jgi:ribosome-associated translation inhibitor RaiA
MTALLEFIRPSGGPARMATPEELVRLAEAVGELEIEPESWGSRTYRARIRFKNRNGSQIWATGTDTDFFVAIAKAIQEAERLR